MNLDTQVYLEHVELQKRAAYARERLADGKPFIHMEHPENEPVNPVGLVPPSRSQTLLVTTLPCTLCGRVSEKMMMESGKWRCRPSCKKEPQA